MFWKYAWRVKLCYAYFFVTLRFLKDNGRQTTDDRQRTTVGSAADIPISRNNGRQTTDDRKSENYL